VNTPTTKPEKTPTWFAFDESRPRAVFAGIWTTWYGTRGKKADPVDGKHRLVGFLTTEPNDVVAPIHAKAMPVILTKPEEIETWMTAPGCRGPEASASPARWRAGDRRPRREEGGVARVYLNAPYRVIRSR
jgi:putative SOS response-associated peptidase YedK